MSKHKYMVHIIEREGVAGPPDTFYFGDNIEAAKAEAFYDGYEAFEITGVYEIELIEGRYGLPS